MNHQSQPSNKKQMYYSGGELGRRNLADIKSDHRIMERLCDNRDYSRTKKGRRIRMQAGGRSIETKRTV